MKNNILIPRSKKKSTASLKLRALCAMSLPNVDNMTEAEVMKLLDDQEKRLSALANDRQHTVFTKQEGRKVVIV